MDWQEIVDILGMDVSPDHLRKTSYGLVEYDNYIRGFEGVSTKILCLSDFHYPFNLPIETFKEYVNKIDVLVLNGDILDCQSCSSFTKTYRINPIEEMIGARKYIIDLIKYINSKKVYINFGNHESRLNQYCAKYIDNEIKELIPDTPLDYIIDDGFMHYDKIDGLKTWYEPIKNVVGDIEVIYTRDWKVKIGNAYFLHPKAFSNGALKTCEKAMDYLHRTDKEPFDTCVLAHTHRVGHEKKGYINLFEEGACCYTDKMRYTDGNLYDPQKEGFVLICQDKDGNIIENKSKVIILN